MSLAARAGRRPIPTATQAALIHNAALKIATMSANVWSARPPRLATPQDVSNTSGTLNSA